MDNDFNDFVLSVKRGKARKGQRSLLKHLNGQRITQRQAIHAKCYDCLGMGEANECSTQECSLYPYSQFKV